MGFGDGSLQLWNFSTGSLIHTYSRHQPKDVSQQSSSTGSLLLGSGGQNSATPGQETRPPPGVTALAQSEFVDTIAVGFGDGSVVLFNTLKDRRLSEFRVLHRQTGSEAAGLEVRTSVRSLGFSKDGSQLLGVGTQHGSVVVFDLTRGQVLTELEMVHSVTSQGSTGVSLVEWLPGEPLLLTSGGDNALRVWILDGQSGVETPSLRLLKSRTGHRQPAHRVRFYGDGHVLLSAGQDRTLRSFHLLRDRQSHEFSQSAVNPSNRGSQRKRRKRDALDLKFARLDGLHLESGGGGSQAAGMSPPPVLPVLEDFCAQTTQELRQQGDSAGGKRRKRGKDSEPWPNIVSFHRGSGIVQTWSTSNRALSTISLLNRNEAPSSVKCVTLSVCGHFALVGLEDGRLEKYNVQSGFFRGSFICDTADTSDWRLEDTEEDRAPEEQNTVEDGMKPKTRPLSREEKLLQKRKRRVGVARGQKLAGRAHRGACVAVCSDGLNRWVLSGGVDGILRFWDFRKHSLEFQVRLEAGVVEMVYNRDNDLAAVGTEDQRIGVWDVGMHRCVRMIPGTGSVSEIAFSPDGRWVVLAAMDASVRVYDIPSGRMIDWFEFSRPVTSLSFSSDSAFLATTHQGSVGINVWVNRAYFSTAVFSDTTPLQPVSSYISHPNGSFSSSLLDDFSSSSSSSPSSVAILLLSASLTCLLL